MIKVLVGDLFHSESQTFVNAVNCVGVMGKGIALEFKKRFPDMYRDYAERCKKGKVSLGHPYLFREIVGKWILNFPTKGHWRSVTKLQDIINGLEYLRAHYREWGIRSVSLPPLGCGHGRLEWRVAGPVIYRYMKQLDIPVELYAPYGTPSEELKPVFLNPAQCRKCKKARSAENQPGVDHAGGYFKTPRKRALPLAGLQDHFSKDRIHGHRGGTAHRL